VCLLQCNATYSHDNNDEVKCAKLTDISKGILPLSCSSIFASSCLSSWMKTKKEIGDVFHHNHQDMFLGTICISYAILGDHEDGGTTEIDQQHEQFFSRIGGTYFSAYCYSNNIKSRL
jgi:hypothetical protein